MSHTNSILNSTGQNRRVGGGWPVLLLFLAAVIIPTCVILWFMNAAVQNEQLAVRQRLVDVYTRQLATVRQNLVTQLNIRLGALDDPQPAPFLFAQAVRHRIADSVIVINSDDSIAYPTSLHFARADIPHPPNWDHIQQLEYSDPAAAALQWKSLAAETRDTHWKATALRNEARALANSNQIAAAVNILAIQLQTNDLIDATDLTSPTPNLLAPAALLRALQLQTQNPSVTTGISTPQLTVQTLDWLERYNNRLIPSSQRLFLLQQFQQITGITSPFLPAEQLAAPFVEDPDHNPIPTFSEPGLYPFENFYVLSHPTERRLLALLRPQTVDALVATITKSAFPPGIHVQLLPDSLPPPPNRLEETTDDLFPRFRLYITSNDPDLFASTATHQRSLYLWTATLTIAATLSLGLLLALYTSRQLRLARLKNDLIATVSHELKTPLSSMRLLVETLLEHRTTSPQQSDEYLTLISRENLRLSRLIDNFLTFSRMERQKHRFEFTTVNLADIIHQTIAAIPDRAPAITTHIAPPQNEPLLLHPDPEALITLLNNLLDNAWKYSNTNPPRKIQIHAHRQNTNILLSISDNGIGIPRRFQRKIFKRFFQIDQSLSRKVGGTGLGLSIVHFIATAHHAKISVESTPNQGSTFTITFLALTPEP